MLVSPTLARAFRTALLCSAAGAAMVPIAALAQDDSSSGTTTPEIVVTGSRITRADLTSAGPVTLINSDSLARSGAVSIDQVLQQLPTVTGDATGEATNNAGHGTSEISLRGLGPERTLVLINGRRGVPSGGLGVTGGVANFVDLTSIPTGMIDRVEVYQDGASAVYGSDAIAGVVNVILKSDFNGIQTNVGYGISGQDDANTLDLNTTMGMSTDKGHVILGIGYLDRKGILQGDRKFSACAKHETSPGVLQCAGSYNAVGGYAFGVNPDGSYHYFGAPWNAYALTWHDGPGTGRAWAGPSDTYNYAAQSLLTQPSTRLNIAGSGEYQLGFGITAFAEGYYTNRDSTSQSAADPTGFSPGHSVGGFYIPASNPYNPTGQALYMYRRSLEVGDRVYADNVQTFRIVAGLKGDFGDFLPTFKWDADVLYGQSTSTVTEDRLLLMGNANIALDPALCAADSACSAAAANAGQTAMNVFGPTTINPAWVPYISAELHDLGGNKLSMYSLNFTGDLFDLPAGTVKLAAGAEYKYESGYYRPDYLKTTGQTDETASPTSGSFQNYDEYVEFSVPLLKDKPFVKSADLDLAGRLSDYNTVGTVETWKAQLNYQPIDDFKIRGIWSTATRVPSIVDLYSGATLSYDFANDPCTNWATSVPAGSNIAVNCAAQGVPGNFAGANAGQIPTTYSGNPNLSPETARTYTLGIVATPTFLPGFTATVDYYHYKITGYIDSLPTTDLLELCYESANLSSPYCAYSGTRNAIHQLNGTMNPELNLNYLETEGLDISAGYSTSAVGPGTLSTRFIATNMWHWYESPFAGNVVDHAGTIYGANKNVYTKWRGTLNVNYDLDAFGASVSERWIGDAKDVDAADAGNVWNKVPNVFYTDIEGHYDITSAWTFTAGIDNLFDKQPPFFDNYSDENTDAGTYDVIGRFFWVRLTSKL